jgi:DNA-binding MarR family transcriptional regulator
MPERVPELIDLNIPNPVWSAFVLFMQTAETVLKYSDAQLYEKEKMSSVKLAALQLLDMHNGTMIHSALAAWMFKEPHSITKLIERLKRDELVVTVRDTIDKRAINIEITDKGRKLLRETVPLAREVAERVMSSISEEDAIELGKLVSVLRQNARNSLAQLSQEKQANSRSK